MIPKSCRLWTRSRYKTKRAYPPNKGKHELDTPSSHPAPWRCEVPDVTLVEARWKAGDAINRNVFRIRPIHGQEAELVNHFGDGAFAFRAWETPFENSSIELISVEYSGDGALVFRIRVQETGSIYRVSFEYVSAFRVLDEHGLLELWEKTDELGGRPSRTTFKVRNHRWTKESIISFVASDGWSHVVASDFDCVEIVAATTPSIALEA